MCPFTGRDVSVYGIFFKEKCPFTGRDVPIYGTPSEKGVRLRDEAV